jgi:hypothetical protein
MKGRGRKGRKRKTEKRRNVERREWNEAITEERKK